MQRSNRRRALAFLAISGLLAGTACDTGSASDGSTEGFPMKIQNCGREVTIDKPPKRLYVIGGEAGTLVHAAGGTDRISRFSPLAAEPLGDAADALGRAEQASIKSSKEISREVLIEATPDLVVAFGLGETSPEDLEAAGIPSLIISGYCGGFGAGQSKVQDPIKGIFDDITTLGRVLGTEQQAEKAVTDLRRRVDAVSEQAKQAPPRQRRSAAVFVDEKGGALGAYGRRSMIHQQLGIAGLSNVFEGTDERLFDLSTEALVDAAPQQLIALHEPGDTTEQDVRSTLTGRPELRQVPAIAATRVTVLNFYYSGHGTLAIDGLEQLAKLIK